MEGDWPLTSWPFPSMADALAQTLSLCPGTLCVDAPGTREREHPTQKALSLHLSLMDNPWRFSCVLTVPRLCFREPGSSLSPWGLGGS